MSFDLYFCRPDGSLPSVPELKEYFSASPFFQVTDVSEGGVEFWYQNEATGVYCSFSYSPLDANELAGCGSSGLSFNLNYNRPSFFAYETMPLVEAFSERFNLLVEDSQEETVGRANASGLIESWRSHNAKAMGAMTEVAKEEDVELHYLHEQRATGWWRYMRVRQEIEDTMTEDVFIPSLMLLMSPEKQLFTMMVGPKGIAQLFPPCDYVYVQREKKRLFGTREEIGLVPYNSVLKTIEPILDVYQFRDLQLKYLSPDQTQSASRLIQTLNLEPIDLKQCARWGSDSFHDVEVPAELS